MKLLGNLFFIVTLVSAVFSSCSTAGLKNDISAHPQFGVLTLVSENVVIPKEYVCDIQACQFVEMHARIQGYLDDIYVDEGQFVKKGEALFQLSSGEYREAVAKAEANLQRAVAETKARQLNVKHISLMVDKNVISNSELEVAQAQLEAAESGIREAKSVLENAKINLNYTFVRAPFDGIVDRLPFKRGSLINTGTLLTSISNVNEVYAYFKVSEQEYLELTRRANGNLIKAHTENVALRLADGTEYPHAGKIETIEGDFDRETGSIAIRARFPNPSKLLKHGASGKVIIERELKNAVLVPEASTFSIQDKNYVFVVDENNTAHPKSFQSVERVGQSFVTNSLRAGQVIAIEGVQQLRDGTVIDPRPVKLDSVANVPLKGAAAKL